MDNILNIHTEEVQLDGKDTFHNHRYEPTSYEVIDKLFENFTFSKRDILVDYGCGLGRLNFYLEYKYNIKSVGIELNTDYYKKLLKNKENYIGNKENIVFHHLRAENYEVNENENIFYFFNPFSVNVFRVVVTNIINSYLSNKRKITLIIYYPESETIDFIVNRTSFKIVDEIPVIENIRKNIRERFVIFELK